MEWTKERIFLCNICQERFIGKGALVDHLMENHEVLELASYVATILVQENERDRVALDFHRQLDLLKKQIANG